MVSLSIFYLKTQRLELFTWLQHFYFRGQFLPRCIIVLINKFNMAALPLPLLRSPTRQLFPFHFNKESQRGKTHVMHMKQCVVTL